MLLGVPCTGAATVRIGARDCASERPGRATSRSRAGDQHGGAPARDCTRARPLRATSRHGSGVEQGGAPVKNSTHAQSVRGSTRPPILAQLDRVPARTHRARHRAVALLLVTLAAACSADDPLDSDLLASLATEQGDAKGDTWTGTWNWDFDLVACDCPLTGAASGNFDPCTVTPLSTLGGDGSAIALQGDGFLVFESPNAQLSGAVNADGSFDLAAVFTLTSLIGQAAFYMRMDGEFEGGFDKDSGTDNATMSARVRQRVVETVELQIDCRSEWRATASRTSTDP